jgi:ABC-type nitrate/sulfonate/bicarbonate transport system substrate-binding protein
MKLAIPDLISNSYFPALAAVDLGFFAAEGLDVEVEHIFPVDAAYRALRDGRVDLVAGSAHAALSAFPEWQGARLLCAQARGMYWFLVMHADYAAARGDVSAVRSRRIGAAPWVDMGLRRLLVDAGIDVVGDNVSIGPIPRIELAAHGFGVMAARALEARVIDGFWANGMAAEVAVRRGIGTVVLDTRRGDGPAGAFDFTFGAVAAADRLLHDTPDAAPMVVRAIVATQRALAADPGLAEEVGAKRFPRYEATLIADLVRRDVPFYDAAIRPAQVRRMNDFARSLGLLQGEVPYDQVVAPGVTPA